MQEKILEEILEYILEQEFIYLQKWKYVFVIYQTWEKNTGLDT